MAVEETGHNSMFGKRFLLEKIILKVLCKDAFPTAWLPLDKYQIGKWYQHPSLILLMFPEPCQGTDMLRWDLTMTGTVVAKRIETLYISNLVGLTTRG
jgi:hypothetical protein